MCIEIRLQDMRQTHIIVHRILSIHLLRPFCFHSLAVFYIIMNHHLVSSPYLPSVLDNDSFFLFPSLAADPFTATTLNSPSNLSR